MYADALVSDFQKGFRIDELASLYRITKKKLKALLIARLGKEVYVKTTRANGGRAVAIKLQDPAYKRSYQRKMSQCVEKSLAKLMQKKEFRDNWRKKAASGSRQGTKALLEKMKEPEFYHKWKQHCRIGGIVSYKTKSGIHSSAKRLRRKWSVLGLKKTGRKCTGPKGERMYNKLEVSVALLLHKAGLRYSYEKLLPAENVNGFVSVDFVIAELPGVFIEATSWDKPKEKITELRRKFSLIKNNFPKARLIVVVPRRRVEQYKDLADTDINLFTPIQLTQYLSDSMLAG
jgi:hypothetical protein